MSGNYLPSYYSSSQLPATRNTLDLPTPLSRGSETMQHRGPKHTHSKMGCTTCCQKKIKPPRQLVFEIDPISLVSYLVYLASLLEPRFCATASLWYKGLQCNDGTMGSRALCYGTCRHGGVGLCTATHESLNSFTSSPLFPLSLGTLLW
ncbi:hypothetical protein BC827DRAFT_1158135 [Russula dissimulans]|nr:hypothetical protein BC827DRAFT_1158135 [Russula dissimulans]